jgi:hypothetical protein
VRSTLHPNATNPPRWLPRVCVVLLGLRKIAVHSGKHYTLPLILCLPQQLCNHGRCASLGRADTHRRGEDGNASAFAPSVPLSSPRAFPGRFLRSERRICDTLRSTIRRRSTAAASPTNVVCSVFSSEHPDGLYCIRTSNLKTKHQTAF